MNKLQLNTNITADFLEQVEAELVPVIHECILKYRSRYIQSSIYRLSFAAVKPLSLLCLVLSIVFLFLAGRNCYFIEIDVVFIVVSLLILILFWNGKKAERRLLDFFQPYRLWLARTRTSSMLKAAKKTVPFNAEYDFRGDLVVYYRTKDEISKFVWSRRMKGFRFTGNGFTLLFKKDKSIYPYGIILHDSSGQIESYLDGLGIKLYSRFEVTHPD